MIDALGVPLLAIVAVVLMIAGAVGCVLPAVPGAPLSLAGVYLYWWGSGFADPGTALLVTLTLMGVLAVFADFGSEVVSARVGGASVSTSIVAGAVGIVLFALATPVGALLGVLVTVFVLEYRRHRDAARGAKAAGVVVLGMLGSTVVQVVLTGSMLAAFVVGVFL